MVKQLSRAPRVLLVENLERLGKVISWYLLEAGFDVSKVERPELVVERLQGSAYDVIVFNTGMPADQKSSFIRRWRDVSPEAKILEISPNPYIWKPSIQPDEVGAADMYLSIPFNFDDLGRRCSACSA